MNELVNFLKGKKTYITALVSVVTGVWSYIHGKISFSEAVQSVPGLMVYLGTAVATLRAAVSKVEDAVKK